jgi:hypothetical protein
MHGLVPGNGVRYVGRLLTLGDVLGQAAREAATDDSTIESCSTINRRIT